MVDEDLTWEVFQVASQRARSKGETPDELLKKLVKWEGTVVKTELLNYPSDSYEFDQPTYL